MSTLSNVSSRSGGIIPARAATVAVTLPEAKSQKGVSVRYAPSSDMKWYVLRATYGRERKVAEHLINNGTYAYVAQRYVRRRINNKLCVRLMPLLPNLVFAYMTAEQSRRYVRETPELPYIEYYYNRLDHNDDGFNPPLVIPESEMVNFILATHTHNEHVLIVSPERCKFRNGDRVLITQGAFCGVEGRVARIAGQQRVVVTLTGIGFLSTAYIPTAFIERVEN
ncbi:MAG: UpxY family transcription antiterminator [Muribaculaceae bacterium]|nr:UpxY family transcription antiterminator [Muribaculaceae bacterium]MBR1475559.1 UpxY family transcription antiterminator [Muribaculaceae bacterium]